MSILYFAICKTDHVPLWLQKKSIYPCLYRFDSRAYHWHTGDGKRRKFTSSDNSIGLRRYPELWGFFFIRSLNVLHIADKTFGLATMDKRTGLEQVALQVQSRNVWYLPSQVPTSSSLVWIQTSQRPMSVDSYVLEYCYTHDWSRFLPSVRHILFLMAAVLKPWLFFERNNQALATLYLLLHMH